MNQSYKNLIKQNIRGIVKFDEPMYRHTTFHIGGNADVWVEPCDKDDLASVLKIADKLNLPYYVIGRGSNVLVKDEGIRGIVIHLANSCFSNIKRNANNLFVGAGVSIAKLLKICCIEKLSGLEFLSGIPGTIGGGVITNVGGGKNRILDYVENIEYMDDKKIIVINVKFKLNKGDEKQILANIKEYARIKKDNQPIKMLSAGCIFKNPDKDLSAGKLIDSCGLKGKRIGGAEVSQQHANFIVTKDSAKCSDVLELIKIVREKVEQNCGVKLKLDINVI